jgi:fibronectin-binding autotransporter adhesin
VVTKPITITVTGSNDTPDITSEAQAATIAERADTHGSATPDTANGAIAFSDVDLTDTHEVNITSVHASGVTTGLANGTMQLSWLSLGPLHDSTDGAQGSRSWSFSAPDSYFDYLADGQSVMLTYTVEVDDHHGGITAQDIVVTVKGSNDAPEIANIAQQGLTEQTDTAPLTTTIPVTFTDRDLSDVGHGATITHAAATGTTTGLALDEAALIALVTPGAVTKAAGSTAGAVNLSFSAASTAFDYLAEGQVLTLTYTVVIDDGDGGVTPQNFVVKVTGTNDAPSIVGEVDPSVQTVIVAAPTGPIVLAPGINVNSLGLNMETFDGVSAGVASNNGAGSGNFESAALGAHFSASGNSGIVVGSSSVTAAPFVGPLPGARDTTNYLSIGGNGTETITFASEKNAFGLYWGSLDSYNTIKFYDGTTLVASYTGNDILPLFPTGNQGSFASNGYVEFSGLHSFNKVVLGSSSNAFEIDNISAGNIPSPGLSGPIKGTLNVHDADVGDALTAFVIGNATIEYNGLSSVPGNIDISALVNAADVTFDIASSNGGTVVLNWTYQPINANLGFLNAGDILKIKYVAEVSDGHGHTGSQPLTITLVGAENTANTSLSLATGPLIDTDAVSVTENGDGTTTVSGLHVSDGDATAPNDTFTVSAAASSAGGSVIPPAANGSLAAVNAALNSGIHYDPGNNPPQTDMVKLTVSDGLGHSDTVHFVFHEAGQGPVTLNGTSGKDVIFATGSDDTLTGGASADQFVFASGQNPSADTITDFTPGQDRIDLRLFSEVGSDNINGWLSTHAVQSTTNPADVLITLGNEALTLKNVTVTSLHVSDFIVSPHHVT